MNSTYNSANHQLSNNYNDCGIIAPNNSINNYPMRNRNEIFSDDFHLNNKGSRLFSDDMAKYIIKNVI